MTDSLLRLAGASECPDSQQEMSAGTPFLKEASCTLGDEAATWGYLHPGRAGHRDVPSAGSLAHGASAHVVSERPVTDMEPHVHVPNQGPTSQQCLPGVQTPPERRLDDLLR